MFIDRALITIKSGDGGDGMTSFMRMKGVAKGGPDGGDGGNGGDVYFEGTTSLTSLLGFRYKAKYTAGNGETGGTNKCYGKTGGDVVIKVPLGTLVKDAQSGGIIADIYFEGEKKLVLKGGAGGKGNVKFTTSRRQAPTFSQKGEKTQVREIVLELKTIADVGLIGFPNVGKSTLLSKISAATPKIANYHFTTLTPNLGAVTYYDNTFTAADIPGLIEGAAEGAGLGHDFLRHIERTRMLVHVVDISGSEGREPFNDYLKINAELKNYSPELAKAKQIIAANKSDLDFGGENLKAFKERLSGGETVVSISAITGDGTHALLSEIVKVLKMLPPAQPIEHEPFTYGDIDPYSFEIERGDDGVYIVLGALTKTLDRNVLMSDPDSMAYFHKTLKEKGVIKQLRKAGAKDGDSVIIGQTEFDFID